MNRIIPFLALTMPSLSLADQNKIEECNVDIICKKQVSDLNCKKTINLGLFNHIVEDSSCLARKDAINKVYSEEFDSCVQKRQILELECTSKIALRNEDRATVNLMGNGEPCVTSSECNSGYCYPGPTGNKALFCLDWRFNCAFPGKDGANYGDIVKYENIEYICSKSAYGPAKWRRLQ